MPNPDPIEFRRTRWLADPDACGSFSYLAVGSSTADRRALRSPVGDRLLFAGEATSVDQPGTVTGALIEGRGAAGEIVGSGGRTIVVGAGAAGLACAAALQAADETVSVLESRRRLGGRVHTVMLGTAPVDLGASWIHGVIDNPLTELVAATGSPIEPARSVTIRRADGSRVDQPAIDRSRAMLDRLREAMRPDDQRSVADHVDPLVAGLPHDDAATARAILTAEVAHSEAADLSDVAIESQHEHTVSHGDDALVGNGLSHALQTLATGLDIEFDRRVTAIVVRPDRVEVVTDDGTARHADRCVVTVPLGVLRSGRIGFDPPLPATTRDAIARLGMGLLDKVALRFAAPFWDDTDMIYLADDGFDFVSWSNLHRVTGQPILVGYVGGRTAIDLTSAADDTICASAMRSLAAMYR